MELAKLIPIILKLSISGIVFCLGLRATFEDASYLLRRPGELVRSLISMTVLMPILVILLLLAFDFQGPVALALVALAVSPIPPILPKKQIQAGGRASYTIGLMVAVSLLAIITVPLAVYLVGRALDRPAQMAPIAVAQIVLTTVLIPLALGMVVHHFAPAFAEKLATPLARIANILLLLSAIVLLVVVWPVMWSLIGNGTLAVMAAFVVIGLTVGHLMGGPDPDDRTVLALATATRHPGMALGIATAYSPGDKAVFGAVLLFLLVNAVVSIPYLKWRKKRLTDVLEA